MKRFNVACILGLLERYFVGFKKQWGGSCGYNATSVEKTWLVYAGAIVAVARLPICQ